jgi:prepilin-type N-terminal cleavage/methylation domain-containing protein
LNNRNLHNERGFTLLEVMIALAILAAALVVLLGAQTRAVVSTSRANSTATAAQLARGKMFDLEDEILTDGFTTSVETEWGDFRDEGYEGYEWEALIEPVEITPDAMESFDTQVFGQLYGESGESGEEGGGGALTGSSAVSQYMPMILSQIPQFINQLGQDRVRKITLEIKWEDMSGERSFRVEQFVVDYEGASEDMQNGNTVPGGTTPPALPSGNGSGGGLQQ